MNKVDFIRGEMMAAMKARDKSGIIKSSYGTEKFSDR